MTDSRTGVLYHRQTTAHQNLCGSDDPLIDYIHDVTCPKCLALMRLGGR